MTTSQLLQAIAANHSEWFSEIARAMGGQVEHHDGVTWTYTPRPIAEVTIAFPTWTAAQVDHTLDEILDWCRARAPIHQISCWCLDVGQPIDLGARLVARGFGWGWQPHWMWLDLQATALPQLRPEGVQLSVESDLSSGDVPDLPNNGRPDAAALAAIMQRDPDRAGYFVARIAGRVVGHCAIVISDSPIKVAGMYDVGVVPAVRGRGIGLALVLMACAWAKAKGCQHVTLNSTPMGKATYQKAGFVALGDGQTWWMREADLAQPTLRFTPLARAQIDLVEALGRGDIAAANKLATAFTTEQLNAPLLNRGLTLAEMTVHMRQPASTQWLARHGADAAVLTQVTPRLPVRRVATSVDFYVRRLGFRVYYQVADFAIVGRNNIELHLYQFIGAAGDLKISCRVAVQQIDGLWQACVANQVIAADVPVTKMPWGAREFLITDPDQNTLIFTE